MSNLKISLIIATLSALVYILIPTFDVLINPGKYDSIATGFGLIAGFFVALFIFVVVLGLSVLVLRIFRKNR